MTLDILKAFGIFNNVVQICTKGNSLDVEKLCLTYTKLAGSDEEKKMAVDQCFINYLHNLVKMHTTDPSLNSIFKLLNFIIMTVEKDLCSSSTLFIGLTDVLDVITLDECEVMFTFIEERVDVWKSEIFYNSGKNYLLRLCNDLLRRLSKSQNTIFCGRIQLFLARLFPLEERSGLNLMSQFNIENITSYTEKSQALLNTENQNSDMNIGEQKYRSVDYNLYSKFWHLQEFFRKPTLCYEKNMWDVFIKSTDEILSCFKSFKLDNISYKKKQSESCIEITNPLNSDDNTACTAESPYFAKYLTSEKLLDLQLSDSNFRRNILIQFLITFQYLTAPVKSKTSSQVLQEDQVTVVNNLTKLVYQLLDETPPDGPKFSKVLQHILVREENWNSWKNEGCVNYIRRKDDLKNKPVAIPKSKKRSMVNELRHPSSAKIIKMGNAELTRLWNTPSDTKNIVPSLDKFFEEAIQQLDPQAGVEDQYKLINDPTFSWKSLRLLSRGHPLFFTQQPQGASPAAAVQPPKTTAQFLESIIGKIAKEGSVVQQQVQCVVDKKPDFSNGSTARGTENYEDGLNDDVVGGSPYEEGESATRNDDGDDDDEISLDNVEDAKVGE